MSYSAPGLLNLSDIYCDIGGYSAPEVVRITHPLGTIAKATNGKGYQDNFRCAVLGL
ncbi:hypothetical protein Cenrod_0061 [Candidatus Symbiobacter mobilis CR]|uniref:Uncharacterized protein n=1 Tax=Candidatus Symbiobacter mobilis CR TaxID=946483 RepID=U5N3Y2_9BURK|nr:hypothetical protein Cenrod_0061 [Candidatus Symbiobacter mobilis CR]